MSLFQAVVLGAIQGVTEFLPISSSGHLVLFQTIFGMKEPMLAFDVALHGGTLLVVLIYFWKDIGQVLADFGSAITVNIFKLKAPSAASVEAPHAGLWICILITLIPTGLIAVLFKDFFETKFSNLVSVAVCWMIMGILFVRSRHFQKGQKDLSVVSYGDSFWIGLVQGLALLPGVSRSGSTILIAIWLGYQKETAAKFSFLISIPAVLAALALELPQGASFFSAYPIQTLAGFVAAVGTGYMTVRWLMNLIQKGRFYLFGFYCVAVSLFAFTFLMLSK